MSSEEINKSIDWLKCVICQTNISEGLQCPAELTRSDVQVGTGYGVFTANLERFVELNDLPMDIDISLIDDGSGVVTTLMKNKAKWHKSCRNRYLRLY